MADAALMVRVVGGFAVCRAGRVLSTTEVGSRKARRLLALLALRRGYVPVDSIITALWGDAAPRNPSANIATLVSRLRAALGGQVITGGAGGYRLGEQVRVDVADAAELVTEAERYLAGRQPSLALRAARRALQLLDRGAVLPEEPEARWADLARARHGELLRRARHATADAALRIGDIGAAQAAAHAAVTADAFDEAACRMLMRAHHAASAPALALRAYQRLRATLATELGVDPARATRNLYVAILQDTTAPAAG